MVKSNVIIPLSLAKGAIPSYVSSAIEPLLHIFEGFELGGNIINDLAMDILNKR
jgi:hypothetical protein